MASQSSKAAKAMSNLSLDSSAHSKPKSKVKKQPVADSWEDEDLSSEDETSTSTPVNAEKPFSGFAAPPPTPSSPSYSYKADANWQSMTGPTSPGASASSASRGLDETRRPEKTDAVARRMISAALGVRARPTEEQRAYDRAVREKEKKRKEEEKEVERQKAEEAQRAKAAIWED
ncbi:hypothetical protein F5Y15DRAFT_116714 [Xylariaceae sp. FL0016]|nr:hypothetical protein F5Y15DRAFT_116714 [Xylariaceae sp. FL0016]